MFDTVSESALLAEMCDAQRDERVAVARRLFAAGRLCRRRMSGLADGERTQWCVDNWEAAAAEVGAELGISRSRASAQMNYGLELLERLPLLGAAFAAGEVDFRVVAAAVFRTGLITDPQVLGRIDALMARFAKSWNRLSQKRLAAVIDRWVAELDPTALRKSHSAEQDRHIEFGAAGDGMVEFWGALRATDAAVLERRIDELADSAPPDDTRTKTQRRADALAALAAGGVPGSASVVVHVLADAATLESRSDKPGHLPGYGNIPANMLRELATRSRLRPLTPAALLCQEPRYRPSVALADYIRCRDLHCRFPGCDAPAEHCDIDHTVPWQQGGPTHPSNLALLCRTHHLLKTFWTGENGWAERQYSDGTIIWISPSGRRYTTEPGGALLYPQLAEPTVKLTAIAAQRDSASRRTLMMPTRRRPRAEDRSARIRWERGLNAARWHADPPPF